MGFQGFISAIFFQTLLAQHIRCSHLFAPRDCCPSKATFPSLMTTGTIYFYMPLDMKSGGPADTHWFHGSLGKLGYKTQMFKINEEYNDDSLTFTPLTQESFENLVFQKTMQQLEDLSQIKKTKRKIARIKTLISEVKSSENS